MSTNAPYTTDARANTDDARMDTDDVQTNTTDTGTDTRIEARGRADPWAAPDEGPLSAAARAPRQFEPTCRKRLRNAMDDANAYTGK